MLHGSAFVVGALGLVCAAVAQAPFPYGAPCWEIDYGTPLNLGDDAVATHVPIGFTFPRPGAGGHTTEVAISSNGFVWLDATQTASEPSESVSALLNGSPRIAPAWSDLDPSVVGDVFVNRSFPNRFVVTWNTVTYFHHEPVRVQLQMYPDGSFSIYHLRHYNDADPTSVPAHLITGPLVGVSRGLGAPDPGQTDLSWTTTPLATGPNVYELFDITAGDRRDVNDTGLLFTRNPVHGGFTVSVAPCASHSYARAYPYGVGCPSATGAMIYEWFQSPLMETPDVDGRCLRYRAAGQGFVVEWLPTSLWDSSYGPVLALADDELSGPIPLGFGTSYFGVPTNSIEVGSNGFVNLLPGVSAELVPLVPGLFVDGPPRLGMLAWDLDPTAGGSIHVKSVGGPGAYTIVTFQSVPEYLSSTVTVTMQARFTPNGDIVVTYGNDLATEGIIGITKGDRLAIPPEVDLTAALPETLSGHIDPPLGLVGLSWPAIGHTFEFVAHGLAPGTLAVVAHVGVSYNEIDLTFLGMPGCVGYALTELGTLMMNIGTDTAEAALPIPPDPALVHGVVFLQAFELTPGINALGLGASNRLELHIAY